MNAFEMIAVIVIIVSILDGMRIGLVKTLFKIVKLVVGALIASIVCSPLVQMIPGDMKYLIPLFFISIICTVFGVLGIIVKMLNVVDKIPVARMLNRIAGIPAGLIYGVISVWIIITVAYYFADTSWGGLLCNMVSESELLSWLGSINPMQGVIIRWQEQKVYI